MTEWICDACNGQPCYHKGSAKPVGCLFGEESDWKWVDKDTDVEIKELISAIKKNTEVTRSCADSIERLANSIEALVISSADSTEEDKPEATNYLDGKPIR